MFSVSDVTDVAIALKVEVHSIVFNPGASAFTVTPFQSITMPLILSGAGVKNNSNSIQTFVAAVQFLNEGLISVYRECFGRKPHGVHRPRR